MRTGLGILAALSIFTASCSAQPVLRPSDAPSAGAVSAADPRAVDAGTEVLRAGGSATDAAIAVMLALTVVEPQSSGIGGGGFYVTGNAAGQVETINGREKAPAAATSDWFLVNGQPREFDDARTGGLSTGVPGNVALAAKAHDRHGRLPWARLFAPAIRLAEEGFKVTPRLHDALERERDIAALTGGKALYFGSDGHALPVGTTVRNPALAAFLKLLAAKGPNEFYGSSNAGSVAAAVSGAPHNPAPMTVADVTGMTATEEPAVCGKYRGYRICGMGPPSSGATTVYAILKQLERFDLRALGKDNPLSWHLIAESERLAYADRDRYLADPAFVRVPVAGLTDPAYLVQRSALIDPHSTIASVSAGTPPGLMVRRLGQPKAQAEHGTSHFSVADRWGNVVSYTSTIESGFGSGLMVNGYFLNNELTDFSFRPTDDQGRPVANRVEGGKRPRSSMSPTIVYSPDGKVRLVVGAAGGATIICQVAKAIIGVIDFGLSAEDAIALPTMFAPGDKIFVEQGTFLAAIKPQLQAYGHHDIGEIPSSFFKANALEWRDGRWIGAADPRSEGKWSAE